MRRYTLFIFIAVLLSTACKRKDPDAPTVPAPGKALLVFPDQNALCTSGTVISNTQTAVTFSWNSTTNTDGYQLDIKNLLTGVTTTQLSTSTSAQVILFRNTPYSWVVTSRSLNTVVGTASDVWKFYVAGLGVTSYAPFPAVLTAPTYGQSIAAGTSTVNLTWTASDVDNDIAGYDVYFGTATNPPLFKNDVTGMFLNGVAVSALTTYYWKVVAKDAQGNTSTSDIFPFKVN